jgi:hypothetical protein
LNYSHYALFALVIIGISLILKRRETLSKSEEQIKEDDLPDMNEVFLNHAGGRTVIDLVKVFNPSDLMILRSIFASEGIDSYVKSNYFGDLYGSAKESIFSTTVISIFEDKLDDARGIVQQYIQNLQKDKTDADPSVSEHVQTAATVLTGIPTPAADLKYLPELLQ